MRTGIITLIALPILAAALPFRRPENHKRSGIKVPIKQWTRPGTKAGVKSRQLKDAPAIGVGNLGDLIYLVNVNVGGTDTVVHMDTGSADLWIISDDCRDGTCDGATGTVIPASTGDATNAEVTLNFGDSTTGTTARGPIRRVDTTIAGLTLPQHPYAAVDFTNSTIVGAGVPSSGILGLAFPSGSQVQSSVATASLGNQLTIDKFLEESAQIGPLLTRLAVQGQLPQPMFSITLQRNTVDVGGNQGALTLGDLPDGVDNDTLTWVPVRLYAPDQGGLPAPTFAPNEIYPLRWEVVIDNVFFDGQQLPQPASANGGPVSALIDSGNSLLRGPEDLVNQIFSTISPAAGSSPSFPCSDAHSLEFEIGGKRFPVDPRDFVNPGSDASTCDADRLVATDPPNNTGRLFTWSLGDPFFKSNLIAFYFGNLTHPSLDPPRMGFLSTVPKDAKDKLVEAVNEAQANGGAFSSTSDAAPTSTLAADATIISALETQAAAKTSTSTTRAQSTTTKEAEPTSTTSTTQAEPETTSTSTSSTAATTSSTQEPAKETAAQTSSTTVEVVPESTAAKEQATVIVTEKLTTPTGPVFVTNTHLETATPATVANAGARPSTSTSSSSGALSNVQAPMTWALVAGTVLFTVLSGM